MSYKEEILNVLEIAHDHRGISLKDLREIRIRVKEIKDIIQREMFMKKYSYIRTKSPEDAR